MINFRYIVNILGRLLMVEGAGLALCIVIALLYGENDLLAFVYSSLITLGVGALMTFSVKVKDRVLVKKDGYFIVTCIWILLSLFGSLPFLIGGTIPSFADAIFETVSGFTTTGASILNEVEALPHASLFWRALTHWLGGLGIIVLLIAILPGLGIEGKDLYVAEVPGPTHDKITPTFRSMARNMWVLYIALTAGLVLLLSLGGMSLFDSVCHAFATMATGGFSTKTAGLAYWDSAYIQYVITIFMFVAGINFSLLHFALRGKIKKLFRDEEFRWYAAITLVSAAIIAVSLYFQQGMDAEESVRESLFQVVTLLTTTGFVSADYLQWPPVVCIILFLLLFLGASAGSTAGGIKCVRICLLFKNIYNEMKRILHPNGVINVKYNGKSVHPAVLSRVMVFFILYILLFGVGSVVMSLFTNDLATACSATITCLSNVGPGFGDVGPMSNFSHLNDFAKLFLSALMLLGRLEVFTMLVLFSRAFWKK